MPATPAPAQPRRQLLPILLLLLAAASATYFFWPKGAGSNGEPQDTGLDAAAGPGTAGATRPQTSPDGRRYAGEGIEVDANGARILNDAGLPLSTEPLPPAKPIPIKAAPQEVIGYAKDAQGVVKPIKAGELTVVPNSPGTYAVVDMWAEGGPAVVPATKGTALSPEELARLREAEAKSERSRR
ncbi:MAG: hypothetical protein NT117_00565 [Gammaproteobacteria bacterium]|nr:hypothetical protein [Gammaproteobacteria bacterium]